MKYLYLSLFFLSLLVPTPAPAEMPDGADDPAFEEAVEVWLSDDDATSLPALARLAQDGNRAAQILLGQIEQHEANPSRWVKSLSREERRAIFRAPGGKFGRSWLAAAAEDSELARALYAARDPEKMEEVIPDLHALGEVRAMGPSISRLLNHGEWETLIELETQGKLPPERKCAAWYAAQFVSSPEASRLRVESSRSLAKDILNGAVYFVMAEPYISRNELAFTETYWETYWPLFLFIANGLYDPDEPGPAMLLAEALLVADESNFVARACRTRCATAWAMLGGYETVLELGSPVATLIPPDRYEESDRATGELLRRLAQGVVYPSSYFDLVEKSDLCLARALHPIIRHSEPEN